MTTLGTLTYNETASEWYLKYPELQNGVKTLSFQTSDSLYYVLVFYNLTTEALYYSILKEDGTYVQQNCKLVEYDTNLIFCDDLKNYKLLFSSNTFYFGSKDEEL